MAAPEIARLADAGEFPAAFALATEIESELGTDPRLAPVWQEISSRVHLRTVPDGASVSYRPYADLEGTWTRLGVSPIEGVRVPRGVMRWRIDKPGYETRELAFRAPFATFGSPDERYLRFILDPEGGAPSNMVPVEGGRRPGVPLAGLSFAGPFELERYYIGRTEVTNREYQEFVEAGGYERPELWQEPFVLDGRALSFEEAVARFADSSGRPGPSTWVLGEYPEGEAEHPVGGVSWFEAAAYARFRDRSLPTVYHWGAAALPSTEQSEPLSNALVPLANFEGNGPEPVATRGAISASGAQDMAGNVREWAWNAAEQGRYLLGGAWTDPTYGFTDAAAESPWVRRATYGVRLAFYPEAEPAPALLAAIELRELDAYAIPPLSEDAFQILSDRAAYDPAPLNPMVEGTRDLPDGGREVRVVVDSPVPGERLTRLDRKFQKLYSRTGRPSIPPEKLLRALLLQVLYTVRSERMLMEQLEYNLLFRWFVGLEMDDRVWDVTVFTKNRDRLLRGAIAAAFFQAVLEEAREQGLSPGCTAKERGRKRSCASWAT